MQHVLLSITPNPWLLSEHEEIKNRPITEHQPFCCIDTSDPVSYWATGPWHRPSHVWITGCSSCVQQWNPVPLYYSKLYSINSLKWVIILLIYPTQSESLFESFPSLVWVFSVAHTGLQVRAAHWNLFVVFACLFWSKERCVCVNKVFLATACCISVVSTSGSANILPMDTKVTYHWNLPDWLFYLFRTQTCKVSKLKPKDKGREGCYPSCFLQDKTCQAC